MQKPLPPEESQKHLVLPKGFRAELFVSEAELGGGKPICMNWDERGRLWVAVTVDYPNNKQPEGGGHDKLLVCEDIDEAFFGELVPRLDLDGVVLVVTADHSTSCLRKAHTADPVPLLVVGGGAPSDSTTPRSLLPVSAAISRASPK